MQIFHSFSELAGIRQPIHWAAGFFDGVHCGHRQVIASASTPGALKGVLCFEPHPLAVLKPEAQPLLLTPDAVYKASLMEQLGVDVMLVLPFDAALAAMEAREFISRLHHSCQVAGISVGANWRFGKGGAGDASFLQAEAAHCGFAACVSQLVTGNGYGPVCSTNIRTLLASGRLQAACALLGRPFAIAGTVEKGQQLARRLGFPTANVTLPPHAALPPAGVYEIRALIGGETLAGIANIGLRPTIRETVKCTRMEAHFPGWSGNLYGSRLVAELLRFIRPERRFPSLSALQAQIAADLSAINAH